MECEQSRRQSQEQRENARMTCTQLWLSILPQFRTSYLGNGATHSGLGPSRSNMAIKTISWQPCPSATKWRQSLTYTLFPNDPLGWIKLIPSLKSQISPLMSQIPQTRAIKQNVLWWRLGQLRNVQFRWRKGLEVTEHLVLSDCVVQSWVHPDLLQRPHSLALILSLHVPYMLISTHAFFFPKKWAYQKYYKNLYVNAHTPFTTILHHLSTHSPTLPHDEASRKGSHVFHRPCLKCSQSQILGLGSELRCSSEGHTAGLTESRPF